MKTLYKSLLILFNSQGALPNPAVVATPTHKAQTTHHQASGSLLAQSLFQIIFQAFLITFHHKTATPTAPATCAAQLKNSLCH